MAKLTTSDKVVGGVTLFIIVLLVIALWVAGGVFLGIGIGIGQSLI